MADVIVPSVPIDPALAAKIFEAIKRKGITADCRECGAKRELNAGFIHHPLSADPELPAAALFFNSPITVCPTIQVICPRCGHMSQFAYRILMYEKEATPQIQESRPKLGLVPFPEGAERWKLLMEHKYPIGSKVRIVASAFQGHVGQTGVVKGYEEEPIIEVAFDDGGYTYFDEKNLEPIG